jgi:hypothetical protein
MRRRYMLALLPGIAVIATASVNGTFTYYKDVLPILQDHCQSCHQPNGMAPSSFLTYWETRPWAATIEQVVTVHKMPPEWSEGVAVIPKHTNGGLTPREIYTIVIWVEQGAPEGDAHDAPFPIYFEHASGPYQLCGSRQAGLGCR